MKAHRAGVATYRGDVRSIVGEVKGPTTYGGYVVAATANFDAEADRTRVAFVHCITNPDGSISLPDLGVQS